MTEYTHSPESCPVDTKGVTRRRFLSRAWMGIVGLLAIESTGGFVASLWPKTKKGSFGSSVNIASVEEIKAMPVGTVAYFRELRFYLSRVDTGVLAISRKCTHVGCVVPWLEDAPSEDSLSGKGRFNCPCHGGIFDRFGVVRGGPPPRPLDIFPITVEGGEVVVDTGTTIQRSSFDQSQVAKI